MEGNKDLSPKKEEDEKEQKFLSQKRNPDPEPTSALKKKKPSNT